MTGSLLKDTEISPAGLLTLWWKRSEYIIHIFIQTRGLRNSLYLSHAKKS